jgi:hypothetical protein
MAGSWIFRKLPVLLPRLNKPRYIFAFAALTFAAGVAAGVFWLNTGGFLFWRDIRIVPFSFMGIFFALVLSQHIRVGRFKAVSEYVGRNTIVYFTAHIPLIIVAVKTLDHFKAPPSLIWWPMIFLVVTLLLSLMAILSNRFKWIGFLFAFPKLSFTSSR